MAQNIKNIPVWQKVRKTLQGFVELMIGPWLYRADIKSLQEKVYLQERRMYKSLQETEERLESTSSNWQGNLPVVGRSMSCIL